MLFHRLLHLLRRTAGGVRRRPWLHLLSVLTLTAAFLAFGATLTVARNLDAFLARWIGSAELTVYLEAGADDATLERLAAAFTELDGVTRVEAVQPMLARERFAAGLGDEYGELALTLPEHSFPSSIDVHLDQRTSRDQGARQALAARIGQVDVVEQVEVYDEWFERLGALSLVGRLVVWGLGLLTLVVALLVVAAMVRTGVHARRREIEVLRAVGATDRYVRLPFMLEGAVETVVAMVLALGALGFLMSRADRLLGDVLPLLGGGDLVRLTTFAAGALLLGGVLTGLLGARLSLRRLEER
jgi:cell division transport system permease protein